jgi:hypothetical protein
MPWRVGFDRTGGVRYIMFIMSVALSVGLCYGLLIYTYGVHTCNVWEYVPGYESYQGFSIQHMDTASLHDAA